MITLYFFSSQKRRVSSSLPLCSPRIESVKVDEAYFRAQDLSRIEIRCLCIPYIKVLTER